MKCLGCVILLAGLAALGQEYTTERKPELISACVPRYTDEARRAKLEGSVRLSAEIQSDGSAHPMAVMRSLGLGLDENAIDAVKQWRFKPGENHGQPVTTKILVDVEFRLKNDPSKTCASTSPNR